MYRCSVCNDWGKPPSIHLHIEEEVEGLLEPADIERSLLTKVAEEMELVKGTILYRYFEWVSDISLISSSQKLASRAHCLCINCLVYSLSFIPHYGDGAYCTTNENLKNEHPRIYHTHGIDIRVMNYRAVMRVVDASGFKKMKKTAGVTRSIPLGKNLSVGDLVFTEDNALKIIGFQKWEGTSWVDVLLEDVKGVS